MGYRSDILIAIAFKTKTQRDEIWAVYCIDPRVQKHKLAGQWLNSNEDDFIPILYYYAEGVKWYDSYDDVTGIEYMREVAEQFEQNRNMPFAWIKYRIGEELTDVEVEEYNTDDSSDNHHDLISELWERANIVRHIEHNF